MAAASTLLLALVSCSSGTTAATTTTATSNLGNFSTTVFLGDSLTAGFQSGSLLDLTEVHGWAPLVAAQAKFPITQALIAPPGAPAILLLKSLGPPPVIASSPGVTSGRDNPSTQVTDLAVPGAELNDVMNTVPLAHPTTGQEQITQLVLGFPGLGYGAANSQATFAVEAKPTTIFLWIGNNDALVADETGMPASMTSVADFTTQYQALMAELTSKTTAHLVIGNVPDVTLVPYMTPAAQVLGEFSAATGMSSTALGVLLGIAPGDLVNPEGLGEIAAILAQKQAPPISDAGVLSVAEQATVRQRVTAFNQVIATQATAAGATLVDINALFAKTATTGLAVNGYTGTFGFLGGIFSLDGIHPTNTGYALLANTFIDTMNATGKTSIPDVNLATVAATDALWPPNFPALPTALPSSLPTSLPAHIALSPASLEQLHSILLPDRLRR